MFSTYGALTIQRMDQNNKREGEEGESTLNPPKIIITSIIFLNFLFLGKVWTSHLGLFLLVLHIFD
jgi:hypothetical protein